MPELSTRTTALIDLSISLATMKQYKERINQIQQYMACNGLVTLTLDDFLEFLIQRFPKPTFSTLEGYRSAVQHFQRTRQLWCEEEAWSTSWACRRAIAGLTYQGKNKDHIPPIRARQRGQVDPDMFSHMISLARQQYRPFAPAFELSYRVALRPEQVMALQKGCYTDGFVWVPDKTANARNHRDPWTKKEVSDETAKFILQALEEKTTQGSYWTFAIDDFRAIFKKIVDKLQWEQKFPWLKFDGPHCLRHGGMRHLDNLLADLPEEARLKKMQISKSVVNRYTRPNSLRKGT